MIAIHQLSSFLRKGKNCLEIVFSFLNFVFFSSRRRTNSVLFPSTEIISSESLTRFILENSQLALRIQTSLQSCTGLCIPESIERSTNQRRSIIRSIRHNRQVKSLIDFELESLRNEIAHGDLGNVKESQKMKRKLDGLVRFERQIVRILRKLHKLFHRSSLLHYFIVERSTELSTFVTDENVEQLVHDLEEEVFEKPKSNKPKKAFDKNVKINSKPVMPKTNIKSSKKDEL